MLDHKALNESLRLWFMLCMLLFIALAVWTLVIGYWILSFIAATFSVVCVTMYRLLTDVE